MEETQEIATVEQPQKPEKQLKITPAQKRELCRTYILGKSSIAALARKYGISERYAYNITRDERYFAPVEAEVNMNRRICAAMMNAAAPHLTAQLIDDALTARDDKYQFLTQAARRDVLDRAGIRAPKAEADAINITLNAESIDIGMPQPEEDKQ